MIGRYRAHLEAELVKQELLLKLVIHDKDKTIARLEEEVKLLRAKNERLELVLLPRLHIRAGEKPQVKEQQTTLDGETSWQSYLKPHIEEEEKLEKQAKEAVNGVSGQNGQGLHEQASGDAQRPNGGVTTVTVTTKGPVNTG